MGASFTQLDMAHEQVEFYDPWGHAGLSAVQADEDSSYVAEATVFSGFAGEVGAYCARSIDRYWDRRLSFREPHATRLRVSQHSEDQYVPGDSIRTS